MSVEKISNKKGICFRARFRVNNNDFKSPRFGTRAEAKQWESRKRTQIADGQVSTGSMMLLEQFVKLWLRNHAYVNKAYTSALRDEQYLKKYILPRFGHKRLISLRTDQLAFLFADLKREGKLAPKTINNCLGLLKKLLGDAVTWGYITANPATNIPRLKIQQNEPTIFFKNEVIRLLSYTAVEYPGEFELILFALNTGCRLGECCALEWDSVDLEKRQVTIKATYDEKQKKVVPRTKGRRFRKLPLNKDCSKMLREMILEGRKAESKYVFSRVSYYAIAHAKFKRILRKAGLVVAIERKATFHTTRHTFASEFMMAGGDIYKLQKILGHSTVSQTERYSHFSPDHLVGETDKVSFSRPEGNISFLGEHH